jgi:Tripartite tricarboxylate transporter TctB family
MNRLLKRDVMAGLMFVAFAAWGFWAADGLDSGSWMEIGPGRFPRLLSTVLLGFGVAIAMAGLLDAAQPGLPDWSLRPIGFVTLSGLAFATLLQRGGIVAAITATVTIGSLAGIRPRPVAIILLSGALVLASIALFVWAIGIPLPVWPSWWG